MSADFPVHWELLPLEEVMEAIIDYRGKTPKKTDFGIPLITAKIVKGGRILEPAEFIAEEDYDSWMVRGVPKIGDVVITSEAPLGEVAQLTDANVALAQRIVTLRGKEGLLNNDFLLCVMQSSYIQHQLESRASGSTVKGIKQSELRKVLLPIPPEDEQIKIAYHLITLTDKIELNRQTNQTLEKIAQAIFKSWFVDFEPTRAKIIAQEVGADTAIQELAAQAIICGALTLEQLAEIEHNLATTLQEAINTKLSHNSPTPINAEQLATTAALFPNALVESELGEIPEGWGVAAISDFGEVVCGKTPSKKKPEYYGNEVPFIKIPDMHGNVFVTKANEYLSNEGAASQPKKSIPKGSICVSCIATVGLVVIAVEDSHTNQQINSIVPHKEAYTPYLYFRMKSLNRHLHELASGGSATLNLNTGNFSRVQIIKPVCEVLNLYQNYAAPLLDAIHENSNENHSLAELRDTLLPKLLSGEINV